MAESNPEKCVYKAKISPASVVVLWLSVPAFLAVGFCGLYLPGIIGYYANTELMKALADGLAVETAAFGSVVSAVREHLFGALSQPITGVIVASVVLLVVCWFVWACVCTKLHFRYSLEVTDFRVVGSAGKQQFNAPLQELKNVFVGQSLFGRIFRFGTVTVQAKNGSVTVKNVTEPQKIKMLLMSKITD